MGDQLHRKLDQILAAISSLQAIVIQQGTATMSALSDLTAQVQASTTVETSAVTLIQGIAAQITAAGGNPTALAALTAQLNASAAALAAAVVANTPGNPPVPVAKHV
jgi:hypothetical protein